MTICAIHQPNFLPWLPYFDKIRQCGVFVFLDDADYPKSGNSMGSWCNRVKIDMNGNFHWFQCPVKRESGIQPINTVEIRDEENLFYNWEKTLSHAYKRYPNYEIVMDILNTVLSIGHVYLYRLNVAFIEEICKKMNIRTKFIFSSALECHEKSSLLLSQICKNVGAKTYLSGVGSKAYMEPEIFERNGIQVIYQDYISRKADKLLPFSMIDYLFKTDTKLWNQF